MAGGLNKKKGGKQADLARKLALAKQQKQQGIPSPSTEKGNQLTPEEMKQKNDELRFEELLNSESGILSHMNEFGEGMYLTKEQEEEEAIAIYSGVDQIYEGDSATTAPFQDLVSPQTENVLGKGGTENLIPWLKKQDNKDFVVVISEPRPKSSELRDAVKTMQAQLKKDVLQRMIIINADTPAENRRWIKKNDVAINIYCDEKREWMKEYTALGKKRWSLSMFILADGKVKRLVRDMDYEIATTIVKNAVESLKMFM